ncbi:MAG TPA: gluconokinase [Fibrobacteria bacterium]|nr:gluconokinase [Fibrobacteria bacterium]
MQPVRVIVLMGPSGSGKSTLGKLLGSELGWPFYDGDDYHPEGNIAKMSQGLALNDQDRLPWLRALHDLAAGILTGRGHGILACSALKESHRRILHGGLGGLGMVWLKAPFSVLESRLKSRVGHFFKPELLPSQFEILEEPEDALVLDASRDPALLVAAIRKAFRLGPAAPPVS